MVSGSLCLTSFFDVNYLVSFAVAGRWPRRGKMTVTMKGGRAYEAAEIVYEINGRASKVVERA